MKVKKVIEQIRKISKGGFPQYGKIKLRKDEIKKLYPNIKKIKKEINLSPKITFNKGITSTIKYYKDNFLIWFNILSRLESILFRQFKIILISNFLTNFIYLLFNLIVSFNFISFVL